jgi:CheY-like chemotaxis protein
MATRKVLVIDDEQSYLDRTLAIVPKKDWRAETILIGHIERDLDALPRLLKEFRPDFCIVDPHLGRIVDGLTAIRVIRGASQCPIVVFTQYLDDEGMKTQILRHYRSLQKTQILTKNPFPSWEEICLAAGIPQEGS